VSAAVPARGIASKGALNLLAVVLTIDAAFGLGRTIAWRVGLHGLGEGGWAHEDVEGLFALLGQLAWGDIALSAAVGVALVLAWIGARDGLLRAALGVALLGLTASAAGLVLSLAGVTGLGGTLVQLAWMLSSLAAAGGTAAALWRHATLRRSGGAAGWAVAALAATGTRVGLSLLQMALGGDASADLGVLDVLRLVAAAAALVLLAIAAWRASAEGPTAAPTTPPAGGLAWGPAAGGLRLYRAGLLWKLGLALGGVALVIAAGASQNLPAIKASLLLAVVAGLVPSIPMLVGLVRFTAVPDESGARGAAIATSVLWGVGLLLEVGTLVIVLRLQGLDGFDLIDGFERAQLVQTIGQVLGLVTLAVLLTALRRTARALADPVATGRTATLAVLCVVLAPPAIALRSESVLRALGGPALLGVALIVLILAVTFVALYVGLVGRLIADMQRPADGPPAPSTVELS
jgi:hypothetical protein